MADGFRRYLSVASGFCPVCIYSGVVVTYSLSALHRRGGLKQSARQYEGDREAAVLLPQERAQLTSRGGKNVMLLGGVASTGLVHAVVLCVRINVAK